MHYYYRYYYYYRGSWYYNGAVLSSVYVRPRDHVVGCRPAALHVAVCDAVGCERIRRSDVMWVIYDVT